MKLYLQFFFLCWMAAGCSCIEDSKWPINGCNKKFDITDCAYHLYCVDYIYDYESRIDNDLCIPHIHINDYGNGDISPIFLHLKYRNGDYSMIPSNYRNDRFIYETVSLDLSDNKYFINPTISAMPNLATLNLSGNLLTVAKLSNPVELSELKELDLSNNFINMIDISLEEKYFTKLEKLNLSHNSISTLPDGTFIEFDKIKTLDLSFNEINTLNALTFEGLRNVVYLYLAHNKIIDLNSSMIRFSQLIQLDLYDNKIENLTKNDFEKLTQLNKLDMRDNSLKNIAGNIFSNVISLRYLYLGDNMLENIDKTAFLNITQLEVIDLSKNKLRTLPRDMFMNNNVRSFTVEENILEGPLLNGTFDGLASVLKLNLSYQYLTSVENFAFFGVGKVQTLLLNNNKIQSLSNKSLKSLHKLTFLDLSNNQISSLDFVKEDLVSLQSLKLHNNNIKKFKSEDFFGPDRLITLDLSRNIINQIDPNCFKYLTELIHIQISNNPITGTLKEKSFFGLSALPALDISGSLLTKINNRSFEGLQLMRELNISNSKLDEIQFNSFSGTGALEVLDISSNKLNTFKINTTDILKLRLLIISNNLIKTIASDTLKGLCQLSKLILSYNVIESFNNDGLTDQKDLLYLDLSFNPKLHFDINSLRNAQTLTYLVLSDIKFQITFADVVNISLTDLEMSNSGITNVTSIGLKKIKQLDTLVLSKNNIVKVEIGDFLNLKDLRILDLSFNKLSFLQPGVFMENKFLYSLNISHNAIGSIGYGVFTGLDYLHTLDMSYNNIDNLDSERFYEVPGLTVLIADYNKINSFKPSEFVHTSLKTLSIGGNPIPCDLLAKFNKSEINQTFSVTAMTLDISKYNFHGVTCNVNTGRTNNYEYNLANNATNEKILYDIRNILFNISSDKVTEKHIAKENYSKYFKDIVNGIENSNSYVNTGLSRLSGTMSLLVAGSNKTNDLLNRLTNLFTSLNNIRRSEQIQIPKENDTVHLIPLLNKMKQEFEDTIAFEKQNVLNELDKKISSLNVYNDASAVKSTVSSQEALSETERSENSFLFVEVCVGIMFVTMIAFVLYKLYTSGKFISIRRTTCSTRNLQEDIDNSAL